MATLYLNKLGERVPACDKKHKHSDRCGSEDYIVTDCCGTIHLSDQLTVIYWDDENGDEQSRVWCHKCIDLHVRCRVRRVLPAHL